MEKSLKITIFSMSVFVTACASVPAPVVPTAGGSTDARAILQDMAGQLAASPGFRVTVRSEYDAIQPDGQRIAFGDRRELALQRPDHLRVDSRRSDGDEGVILFDGKAVTAYKADANAYVTVDKPGTVDQMVVYLVKDMHVTLPLARLLLTSLPQELDRLFTAVSYVEQDILLDVPTDHLAARSADADVQLWITRSEPRLLRRVIITYLHEPGQPQFRAELDDWDLGARFCKDVFAWTPPAGAERISLMPVAARPVAGSQGVTP